MQNYYRVLGLKDYCTDQDEIKKAYRDQIRYFHPDLKNVSQELAEEKTKELNAAYDVLSDPQKKQIYDSQLRYEQGLYQQSGQNSYNNSANGNYYSNSAYRNNNYYSNSNANRNTNSYSGNYTNNQRNYNSNSNGTYRGNYTYSNYSNTNRYASRRSSSGGGKVWPWIIAFLFLLAMCSGGGGGSSNTYSSSGSSSSSTSTTSQAKDPDANLKAVSVSNGQMFKRPSDEANCGFTVETSGSNGYYIYLKDIKTSGRNDVAFYVKGGNTVTVDVPEGSYKLYYASGSTWYGTSHKFGANTSYTTSDDIFVFSSEIKGNYIYYDSWTVTLYPVTNGNMETEHINESQFPG